MISHACILANPDAIAYKFICIWETVRYRKECKELMWSLRKIKWRCINVSFLLILWFTLFNSQLILTVSRTEVNYLLPSPLVFRGAQQTYNLTFLQDVLAIWCLICIKQEEPNQKYVNIKQNMLILKFYRFKMPPLDLNKVFLFGYSGSAYPLQCPIPQSQTLGSRLCTMCTKHLGLDLSTHLTFTHGWTISFYW